ncbi:MAG: hypothetical protein ABH879_07590 [archaeon]
MRRLILLLLLLGCAAPQAGQFDSFAQCLTESGAVMYGTEWCSHCQNQKEAFGPSFEYINFVDCDKNRYLCESAGVEGFPTWSINGSNHAGEQSMPVLQSLSGCRIYE